ncbi:MAG: hypothetical protein KC457_00555 [Myxococcales bacterium]|nr:hypothetical protein [Myxococcales bacterium]
MKKLISTSLIAFALSFTACGGDDGGTTDTTDNADSADTPDTDGSTNIDCNVFCEAYVTQCIQMQGSTEFETADACQAACADWDQAGTNCRFMQIPDACDQAGNMGSAC